MPRHIAGVRIWRSYSVTLTDTLDRLPPCLVRLVARDPKRRGRRLPLHDLAAKAGLSYGATLRLSQKRTWANVPPKTIDAFCAACGVDILHPSAKLEYLKDVLKHPSGYRLLGAKNGPGSWKNVVKMLQSL